MFRHLRLAKKSGPNGTPGACAASGTTDGPSAANANRHTSAGTARLRKRRIEYLLRYVRRGELLCYGNAEREGLSREGYTETPVVRSRRLPAPIGKRPLRTAGLASALRNRGAMRRASARARNWRRFGPVARSGRRVLPGCRQRRRRGCRNSAMRHAENRVHPQNRSTPAVAPLSGGWHGGRIGSPEARASSPLG